VVARTDSEEIGEQSVQVESTSPALRTTKKRRLRRIYGELPSSDSEEPEKDKAATARSSTSPDLERRTLASDDFDGTARRLERVLLDAVHIRTQEDRVQLAARFKQSGPDPACERAKTWRSALTVCRA